MEVERLGLPIAKAGALLLYLRRIEIRRSIGAVGQAPLVASQAATILGRVGTRSGLESDGRSGCPCAASWDADGTGLDEVASAVHVLREVGSRQASRNRRTRNRVILSSAPSWI